MAEAIQVPPGPMTREEFYGWAEAQPHGRFELEAGEVVAMAPERASHADTKGLAYVALRSAIARAGVRCKAYVDGLVVAVDHRTSSEPDALVDCGGPMEGDPIAAPNPVVVVEVTSPSNSRVDLDAKFQGYFRVQSIMH